jgi:hypothetical protein
MQTECQKSQRYFRRMSDRWLSSILRQKAGRLSPLWLYSAPHSNLWGRFLLEAALVGGLSIGVG